MDMFAVVSAGVLFPSKHTEQFSIWIRSAWKCWVEVAWVTKNARTTPSTRRCENNALSLTIVSMVLCNSGAPTFYRKINVLQYQSSLTFYSTFIPNNVPGFKWKVLDQFVGGISLKGVF